MRRFLIVMLIAASLVVTARPAAACSCATFDTRRALADHPAAFIGTVISRDPPPPGPGQPSPPGEMVTYRFRVERAIKGELGAEVAVRSAGDQSACGISAPAGTSVGLILSQRDGEWIGSLCLQPSPERLARAAEPLPPPDGTLPPQLLVASTYGLGRSVALDGDGRVAAIGDGTGTTVALAACPGREMAVELFSSPAGDGAAATVPAVAVRRLTTMRAEGGHVLADWRDDGTAGRSVEAVACRDRAGRDLLVYAREGAGDGAHGRIVRLLDGVATTVWDGPAPRAFAFAAGGRAAYLNLHPHGEDLVVIDLTEPEHARTRTRTAARIPPGSGPMVESPGRRYLATVASAPSRPTRAVLVDLAASPAAVSEINVAGAGVTGEMVWAGGERVLFTPRLRPAEWVRVFDTSLRQVAVWAGWTAEKSAVSDGLLYGASQGAVRVAAIETGAPSVLTDLEDALVFAILDVSMPPSGESAGAPAPPATTTTTTTGPAGGAPPPSRPSTTTTTTAGSPATPAPSTTAPRRDPPGAEQGQPPAATLPEEAAPPADPLVDDHPEGAGGFPGAGAAVIALVLGFGAAAAGRFLLWRRR